MLRQSRRELHSSVFCSLFFVASLLAGCLLWAPAASAQTYLYGVASYATGNNPVAVVTADFNGDGQLDMAVANSTDNTVTVFLSQPNGTLAAGVTYNVGTDPVALVAADFNGDGHPDLAVANNGSTNVSVLINNGNGTFQAAVPYTVGYQPDGVVAADFNSDGRLDLATANYGDNTVSVLLGNGDGTFQTQQLTAVGTNPVALATGDFNNDGKLDLIMGDFAPPNQSLVTVLLSNGDGTFTRKDSSTGNEFVSMLTVGDFNNDGKLDVATFERGFQGYSDNGETLLGNGDGTFGSPLQFQSPQYGILALASADVNHDGNVDLVAVLKSQFGSSTQVITYLGKGDGTFQPPLAAFSPGLATPSAGPGLALADMNGDGQTDLLLTSAQAAPSSQPPLVYVALGNGDGTFSVSPSFSLGVIPVSAQATGDFNGDGKPDIAAIQNSTNPPSAAISVLLGNGNGTFQAPGVTDIPSNPYASLVTGDFNGDGKTDLAASWTFGTTSTLSVFLGNGDSTFQSPINTNLPSSATPIASGDFNGDGKTDVAIPSFDLLRDDVSVQIFLSNGDGTFTPGFQCDIAPRPATIAAVQVGDFNKDGKLDLAVASGDTIYIFLGNGNGTFSGPTTYTVNFGPNQPNGLAVGDFNGDGNPDLAVSGAGLGLAVLLGTGTGTFGLPIYSNIPGAGFSIAVVGDFNNDGKTDLATAGALYLGNGDGTFTLSGEPFGGTVSADFNSDGVPDQAAAMSNPATLASEETVYLSDPAANLAPSPVNFGQVNVGQSSPPRTVTLTNLGIVSIPDLSLSTTGNFSQTNTCTSALAVSAQCQIEVTFTPAAPGPLTGTVMIADNAPPNPQVVGLSGTGEASSVSFSPTSLNFNVQAVGTSSAPQTVTLTNSGNQPLTVTSVVASVNYSETNTCTAAPVQPNANCAIVVTFSPTSTGTLNGTITVTDNVNNVAGSQQTVPLSGIGSASSVYPSTGSLAFGSQAIGTVSSPQPVMLTNAGTTAVTITGITASANFSETNNCTAPLGAGANCTLQVSFAPQAAGTLNGMVTLTFNAPGSPETVMLTGTGTGPVASLSPTSLTFSGTLVGTSNGPQRVILTNTGTTPLTITGIASTGDFRQGSTCPKTGLAPQSSCTINVSFVPSQAGSRAGTLVATDNAANSPQTVGLTGTGQDFSLAIASGSSTSQGVSPGGTATYMFNATGLGGLNAQVSLSCAGAPVRSTCSVSPATLTPGSTATAVTVTVTTQAPSTVAPWFEPTLPPLNGTNTKLILVAILGMILLAGLWVRERRKPAMAGPAHRYRLRLAALPALMLLLVLGLAGCGGGSGMVAPIVPGTPAGTYNLTLTGTATASSQVLTHNVPLTLTVK